MPSHTDRTLWRQIVQQVTVEWDALPTGEKNWITDHALKIVTLQESLHRLFLAVDGDVICRNCAGGCCGHGKFHPTLVNLLACLIKEKPFPLPRFDQGCPYIGAGGCLFPPGLRPYNCISFICEKIDSQLAPDDRAEFCRLEKEIRTEYEEFSGRYVGAGMRGILVRGKLLPAYLARC